jgi:hypothetical protein
MSKKNVHTACERNMKGKKHLKDYAKNHFKEINSSLLKQLSEITWLASSSVSSSA